MKAPQATCPWIDQLDRLCKKHIRGSEHRIDRTKAHDLCEQIRGANAQLRLAYAEEAAHRLQLEKELESLRRMLPDVD